MSHEPRPSSGAAGLVGESVTCAVLGAVVGTLSAFEALRLVGGVWVGVLLGVLVAAALSFGLAHALRGPAGPIAATGGWVLAVVYLASGRPEGDVVVPGSGQGYAFLLLGVAAMALGIREGTRVQRRYTSGVQEPKTPE